MFHVITGGSGSGKSAYAESCVVEYAKESEGQSKTLYYIATMEPFGKESQRKIEKHRKMRAGKGFQTVECYRGLEKQQISVTQEKVGVLLECMSNLAANEFYGRVLSAGKAEKYMVQETVEALWNGICKLRKQCEYLVVVTNEVCSEGGSLTEEMQLYTQIIGLVNQKMAETADKVTEVVYGIPIEVK